MSNSNPPPINFEQPIGAPDDELMKASQEERRRPLRRAMPWLISLAVLLLLLVGVGLYLAAGVLWLPPKDLGVRTTSSDWSNFLSKAGASVRMDGSSGSSTWSLGAYTKREIRVTAQEATAFLNQIPAEYRILEEAQVQFDKENRVVLSGAAKSEVLMKLLPEAMNQVPFALPEKLNMAVTTEFAISGGSVTMKPVSVQIGSIPIGGIASQKEAIAVLSSYADRLLTGIPELHIESANVKDGELVLEGTFPTEIVAK